MVTLPTVFSFFSTCGCFLRDGRSSSGDLPSLFLACGWPPGANGSPLCEWRRLQDFRVEDPSGARKGRPNRPPKWARPADLGRPRPTSARFGRPFAPVGPHAFTHFAPSTCTILTMSSSRLLTVKIRQPSHEFTFGVGISFIPYPLVLTPVV
jgi:hypothetical protein